MAMMMMTMSTSASPLIFIADHHIDYHDGYSEDVVVVVVVDDDDDDDDDKDDVEDVNLRLSSPLH